MAYRDRDRDEEFRGGAEERGERSQYGRSDFEERNRRSDFEERNRGPQQFGREQETGGRSQGWPSGRGYSGESYGSQPQSYRSQGYGSQGFGSQGYRPQGSEISGRYGSSGAGPEFGRGAYERGFEGMDRESGWGGFPTGGAYGRSEFFQGTPSQSGSFPTPGYSEGQFGSRTRGRFTGRGPKNYTRSDDRIREDVSDRLEQHGEIDATEIEVRVETAEVILEGTVPDRRTKRLAEDVVEDTPGVKQVHNRLRIQGNGGEIESGRSQSASGSQSTSGSQRGQSMTGSTGKSTSRS
jgi:hypothetical protein